MGNFVLIVEFGIRPEERERFHALIAENARLSVELEAGCSQFDVLRPLDDPSRVLLYEVYDDAAAFEVHKAMPHVADFFRQAKEMIVNQSARRLERTAQN